MDNDAPILPSTRYLIEGLCIRAGVKIPEGLETMNTYKAQKFRIRLHDLLRLQRDDETRADRLRAELNDGLNEWVAGIRSKMVAQ